MIVQFVSANYVYILLVFSYAVSFMLYDFMQEGMIFEFYGKWLNNGKNNIIKKPLGLCLKCFHVWVYIMILILSIVFFNQNFNLLFFIITLGLSYSKLVKNYYN